MDRMDILMAWLNSTRLIIPGVGDVVIEDVKKEDGSGQSFIIQVYVFDTGTKHWLYVNTGQRKKDDLSHEMTVAPVVVLPDIKSPVVTKMQYK